MLLENFWEFMRCASTNLYPASGDSVIQTSIRDINGTALGYICNASYFSTGKPYLTPMYNPWDSLNILFGTGTTEVTSQDYRLESNTSAISIMSKTVSKSVIDGKFVVTVTMSCKNDNNSGQISVSEIGGTTKVAKAVSAGGAQGQSNAILIFRQLLNDPIVIPAQQSRTITIEIEMS